MRGVATPAYELIPDEARVVRQVFAWVGRDRLPIGEVCRRLTRGGRDDPHRQDRLGSACGVGHC